MGTSNVLEMTGLDMGPEMGSKVGPKMGNVMGRKRAGPSRIFSKLEGGSGNVEIGFISQFSKNEAKDPHH